MQRVAARARPPMLMNNLEVAEKPDDLIVYGGTGKAARNWECFDAIVNALRNLGDEETLLVQSGKPAAISQPIALRRASSFPTPCWYRLGRLGRTSGSWKARSHNVRQMTADGWIYRHTRHPAGNLRDAGIIGRHEVRRIFKGKTGLTADWAEWEAPSRLPSP